MSIAIDSMNGVVTISDRDGTHTLRLVTDLPLERLENACEPWPVGMTELLEIVGARAIFEGVTEVGYLTGHRSEDLWLQSARLFFLPDQRVIAIERWKNYMFGNTFKGESLRVYGSYAEFARKYATYQLSPMVRQPIVPFLLRQLRRLPAA